MRAAIYARISDDTEGTGLGVARQETECRDLAERHGWEVAGVYTDNDRSAYSGKPRPEYQRLLADVEAKRVDAIVVWHPDRLHRSPSELESFIDLVEQAGVAVATAQGGAYDLSTASGRMTARVVGAVARHESEHKSERLRAKHRELALAGKQAGGGTRPYGYQDDRVSIVPAEAEIVRELAARALAGASMRSLVTDLNDRGVPTVSGVPWRVQTLRRLLLAPRIAGLRQHQGQLLRTEGGKAVQAEWSGIIDDTTHLELVALWRDPTRRPRAANGTSREYVLTRGLGVCGLCGTGLVARPKSRRAGETVGRRCYVCVSGAGFEGCGKIRQLADPLEDLVRDLVCKALAGSALRDALAEAARADDEAAGKLAELSEHEARLADLAALYAIGELSRGEWMASKTAHAMRAKQLQSGIAKKATGATLPPDLPESEETLRELWDSKPVSWRRHLTGTLVDRVEVGPAVKGRNFFDPDRVIVHWRF